MIYCVGDSFTYGDELDNRLLAWPTVLGKMLDQGVINKGKSASCNYRMVKRTIDAVLSKEYQTIIIGWTDPCRQEFADEFGIYNVWSGRNYSNMDSKLRHRIDLIKLMTAYDNPEYYYTQWIRQILLVQALCKANNVKCVMFNAMGPQEHNRYKDNHLTLIAGVDTTNYIDGFTSGANVWTYNCPIGPGGHFLEEGHQRVANKIYEHISNW